MEPRVAPFEMDHLRRIQIRDPERMGITDEDRFLQTLLSYTALGPAFTLLCDEGVICIGGVAMPWPGMGEAWSLTSDLVPRYPKTYFAWLKKLLGLVAAHNRLWRIQAPIRCDHEAAIRTVEHLGFEREGLMRGFFPDGGDAYMYARVN